MTTPAMFHFSFPVNDVERARAFYTGVLGCTEGRKLPGRVDFNFYGHHLVGHLEPEAEEFGGESKIGPSGHAKMPLRHFGVIVSLEEFDEIAARLKAGNAEFLIEPKMMDVGKPREQKAMACKDGCGNALEFKGMANTDNIFVG